jgi:hypothetical protein
MSRKYIDDLGIKLENTPQGWCPNDFREENWTQERKVYGFDSRETWSLDYSFKLWLYERLSMYNEINCIDTSFHKFKYKDETLTQQQCIDRMLDGLRLDLTLSDYCEERKINQAKIDDVVQLFALCFHFLSW